MSMPEAAALLRRLTAIERQPHRVQPCLCRSVGSPGAPKQDCLVRICKGRGVCGRAQRGGGGGQPAVGAGPLIAIADGAAAYHVEAVDSLGTMSRMTGSRRIRQLQGRPHACKVCSHAAAHARHARVHARHECHVAAGAGRLEI